MQEYSTLSKEQLISRIGYAGLVIGILGLLVWIWAGDLPSVIAGGSNHES